MCKKNTGANIGLDFGTTYTVVARAIETGNVEPVDFSNDEQTTITAMESLVVKYKNQDYIGYSAVPFMKYPGASVYKGFKMLLGTEESKYSQNGYTQEVTPDTITDIYLENLFECVKTVRRDCNQIDKVVVGVPYIWTTDGNDSRKNAVVKFVKDATNANIVEFRSEPILACAYYVSEINKVRKKDDLDPFEGYIFIVDYGGGTLDMTLCHIENRNDKPFISVIGSGWGAGENTEGRIGNAGMAYMEEVANVLLKDNEVNTIIKDADYQCFVKEIEGSIKLQSANIKRAAVLWDGYFVEGSKHYDEEVPGIIASYKGKIFFVKYSHLIIAYNNCIRRVLDDVFQSAKKFMDDNRIPYNDCLNHTFKVATIGGFCNFALTEKQIRKDTDWLQENNEGGDTRYSELDMFLSPKNRTLAVAYGAALVANDLVEIKKQCPYTFCCYPETRIGNEIQPNLDEELVFFVENEEYVPGKPMFLGYVENGELHRFNNTPIYGNRIPFISRKNGNRTSNVFQPTETIKLPPLPRSGAYLAMALEQNEELSLYVYDKDIYDGLSDEERLIPVNDALINKKPIHLPPIDTLLGSLYIMK